MGQASVPDSLTFQNILCPCWLTTLLIPVVLLASERPQAERKKSAAASNQALTSVPASLPTAHTTIFEKGRWV